MASTPDGASGTDAGTEVAPPPAVAGSPVSIEELQRTRRLTPAQGAAVFDGLLDALATLEAGGRRARRLDAGSVLVSPSGAVVLADPAGVPAAAAPPDVAAAAMVVRPLLAKGGRPLQRVEHLVDAALEGRAAASVADLRRQLAAAAAPLGAGWNDRSVLRPLATPEAGRVTARRRRRRWPWLVALAVVVLAGAGAAVFFLAFGGQSPSPAPAAPLTIGKDVALTVSPTTAGCNTTFAFHATGSVSGTGSLVYRWEQSDGQTSDNQTVRVTPSDGSFDITQSWRIQGAQTVSGKETFHIIQPVDRAVSVTLQYHCP